MRFEHWPAGLYAIACVLALAAIPLSAAGWLRPDPLAAVPALLLGMPWSHLLLWLGDTQSVTVNLALVALGMAVNVVLFWALGTWIGGW
ncbi:hypothetical protein [Methyloceanibacter sp. wino2]|uniref:SCO4225 family membrane protein n=1 Tax=Methyloceanibacter sp. wino2 TaxID=2170729 RepID=UPI000D3EADFC|nr:hypothetical protein [Methyloceanibacter sp. wino2]